MVVAALTLLKKIAGKNLTKIPKNNVVMLIPHVRNTQNIQFVAKIDINIDIDINRDIAPFFVCRFDYNS